MNLLNAYSPCGLKLCRGRSLTGQRIKTLRIRIITILLLCYAANKISVDASVDLRDKKKKRKRFLSKL